MQYYIIIVPNHGIDPVLNISHCGRSSMTQFPLIDTSSHMTLPSFSNEISGVGSFHVWSATEREQGVFWTVRTRTRYESDAPLISNRGHGIHCVSRKFLENYLFKPDYGFLPILQLTNGENHVAAPAHLLHHRDLPFPDSVTVGYVWPGDPTGLHVYGSAMSIFMSVSNQATVIAEKALFNCHRSSFDFHTWLRAPSDVLDHASDLPAAPTIQNTALWWPQPTGFRTDKVFRDFNLLPTVLPDQDSDPWVQTDLDSYTCPFTNAPPS